MQATAQLAGFFAAHGIWCVSDGEDLIPLVALELPGGERKLERFERETLESGVAAAQAYLEANPDGASRLVLVYDARITLESGQFEALIVDARGGESEALVMAVPYRNASSPEGFAVHKPKFLELDDAHDPAQVGQAFFEGVGRHDEGVKVWNEHLDESV